ncbi:MAG: outer membrane lipoprotein chaperone LolA [Gammaproteobacteria bacterium]
MSEPNPRYLSRWLVVVAGLLMSGVINAAGSGRLDTFLSGLHSFSADFQQVLSNEMQQPLEVSTGRVQLTDAGQFYWHYTDPYSQYIISDGEVVWIYDEDLEQVTINDVGDAVENTPLLIFSGQSQPDEHYLITGLPISDGLEVIELQPRETDSQYQKIRFAFAGEVLRFMVLYDALGHITRIEFSNIRRNPRLDEGLFSFAAPAGVDVIDNRTATGPDG